METKEACDQLSDLMANYELVYERSKDDDGKRYPPYALVHRINATSHRFRQRITGRPDKWKSWVSPFASAYTRDIQAGRASSSKRLLIQRLVKASYRRKMAQGGGGARPRKLSAAGV